MLASQLQCIDEKNDVILERDHTYMTFHSPHRFCEANQHKHVTIVVQWADIYLQIFTFSTPLVNH